MAPHPRRDGHTLLRRLRRVHPARCPRGGGQVRRGVRSDDRAVGLGQRRGHRPARRLPKHARESKLCHRGVGARARVGPLRGQVDVAGRRGTRRAFPVGVPFDHQLHRPSRPPAVLRSLSPQR